MFFGVQIQPWLHLFTRRAKALVWPRLFRQCTLNIYLALIIDHNNWEFPEAFQDGNALSYMQRLAKERKHTDIITTRGRAI